MKLLVNVSLAMFCMFVLNGTMAVASPSHLKVAIFAATEPPTRIVLTGPFAITGARTFSVPPGRYELRAEKNAVALRTLETKSLGANQKAILVHERVIELRGLGANPIEVSLSSQASRRYEGSITVSSQLASNYSTYSRPDWRLKVINTVARREYLASVVASEMPIGAPLEALKAQAVLANTQIAKFSNEKIIDDTTQIQSYLGAPKSRPEAYAAVDQTHNEILKYEQAPAEAFFHSTCAGMTSKPADIFGSKQSLPYLTNITCSNCQHSPFYKEVVAIIPKSKFETVFGATLPSVSEFDIAGRPTAVGYQFHGNNMNTNGYQFWLKLGQSFGWGKAPGTKFLLQEQNGQVLIKSSGAGHGVGLCQWGAIGLAKGGSKYKQILVFYFPGTTISE